MLNGTGSKYFSRLAVRPELELAGDEPGLLELGEVHVQQRPGHSDASRQFAHVQPPIGQLGEDAHALRARDGREPLRQFNLTLHMSEEYYR